MTRGKNSHGRAKRTNRRPGETYTQREWEKIISAFDSESEGEQEVPVTTPENELRKENVLTMAEHMLTHIFGVGTDQSVRACKPGKPGVPLETERVVDPSWKPRRHPKFRPTSTDVSAVQLVDQGRLDRYNDGYRCGTPTRPELMPHGEVKNARTLLLTRDLAGQAIKSIQIDEGDYDGIENYSEWRKIGERLAAPVQVTFNPKWFNMRFRYVLRTGKQAAHELGRKHEWANTGVPAWDMILWESTDVKQFPGECIPTTVVTYWSQVMMAVQRGSGPKMAHHVRADGGCFWPSGGICLWNQVDDLDPVYSGVSWWFGLCV